MSKVADILNIINEAYDIEMPKSIVLLKDIIDFGYYEFETGVKPSTKLNDYFVEATPANISKYHSVPAEKMDEDTESIIYKKGTQFTYKNDTYVNKRGETLDIPPEIYDAGDGVYWTAE